MSRNLASRPYKVLVFDASILFFLIPAIFYPRPITFKILIVAAIVIYILQWRFGTISHALRWMKQFVIGESKKIRPLFYDLDK